jgi:hypothetical protein
MKTGFGEVDTSYIVDAGLNLLNELMRFAVINGSKYAKSAGRDNLSGEDIIYALQYEAHEFPYRNINSTSASESSDDEISDSEDEIDDDADTIDNLNDDADTFTRSSSNDELIIKMNNYHDNWLSWEPETEIQKSLKNAVNKAINQV